MSTSQYDGSTTETLLKATADFVNNVTDPKACKPTYLLALPPVLTGFHDPLALLSMFTLSYSNNTIMPLNGVAIFYNGTTPPPGLYDAFLSIPPLISTVGLYSYQDAAAGFLGTGTEGTGHGVLFGASAFASLEWEQSRQGPGKGGPKKPIDPYARYLDGYKEFRAFGEKAAGKPSPPGKPPKPNQNIEEDPTKDALDAAVFAITHVPKSQIEAGRAQGGNIIDAPLTNYGLVQFHIQLPAGWNYLPQRVEKARKDFFKKCVVIFP